MSETDECVELFQLHDGRYIADEEISRKMFYIKQVCPETFHREDTGYSWDDSGMAELFSECYKNDTRYCAEMKSWFTYEKGVWHRDVEGLLLSKKVREFVRLMVLYCGEIADEEKRKQYLQFVSRMGDRRFRERLMRDARDDMAITATEFDKNPNLINCLNGTYDLENMCFREHDWRDFLTMQTNFEYTMQEDIRCERFERFITEVSSHKVGDHYVPDKDKADYLQRALGYSMLGRNREECMFIAYGPTTRNGKSTLLDAISNLLGDYASVAPVELICKSNLSKNAEAPSPVLARLKGKRLVTMAESRDAGKLDESVIKQLTGGEKITARELRQEPITFLPQFTLWLSCNALPAVRDKSIFASDRLRVIKFERYFGTEERDGTLKEYFATPEVMTGIFSWLVAGHFKYKQKGLTMSPEMTSVINEYVKDNDVVLQFLEQKCTKDSQCKIKGDNLYNAYKIWCRSNGFHSMTSRNFYANVRQHSEWYDFETFPQRKVCFNGLKLNEN